MFPKSLHDQGFTNSRNDVFGMLTDETSDKHPQMYTALCTPDSVIERKCGYIVL